MLAYVHVTLSWGELLAYYFFLALFPPLLFLIAVAGLFASGDVVNRIVNAMNGAAPPDIINIIREQLISLSKGPQGVERELVTRPNAVATSTKTSGR